MDQHAFELLHTIEASWWYRGRAAVIRGVLARVHHPGAMQILDFGAGYGGMYEELALQGTVSAFEPDKKAQEVVKTKHYQEVYDTEAAALSKRYDLIGLFDVIEHIEDDRAFLLRAKTALEKEGRLIITVPAMPFLWSNHDVANRHFRRYTRATLRRVLENAGYRIEYLSFWNTLLFVPAALLRLLGQSGESATALPRALDVLIYSLIRIEVWLMRVFPLPFGLSLVALARKRD